MGLTSSKPAYTQVEVRYVLNLLRLNEEVRAYPFQNKQSEKFYEAMGCFASMIKSGYRNKEAAFNAERAFEQWRASMFGPTGYFPSKYLIFNSAHEVF